MPSSQRAHEKTRRHLDWARASHDARCRACGLEECRDECECVECGTRVCLLSTNRCRACHSRVCHPVESERGGRGPAFDFEHHNIVSRRYPWCTKCLETLNRDKVCALLGRLPPGIVTLVANTLERAAPRITSAARRQRRRQMAKHAARRRLVRWGDNF